MQTFDELDILVLQVTCALLAFCIIIGIADAWRAKRRNKRRPMAVWK